MVHQLLVLHEAAAAEVAGAGVAGHRGRLQHRVSGGTGGRGTWGGGRAGAWSGGRSPAAVTRPGSRERRTSESGGGDRNSSAVIHSN